MCYIVISLLRAPKRRRMLFCETRRGSRGSREQEEWVGVLDSWKEGDCYWIASRLRERKKTVWFIGAGR